MKIALWTPLPPMRSGISDYSIELIPYLSMHVDGIDIVIDTYIPTCTINASNIRILQHQRFFEHENEYDMILYQLGNNTLFHQYQYQAILRWPGIVVLHDCILFHYIAGMMISQNKDIESFRKIACYCYGLEEGEKLTQKVIKGECDPFQYSLNKEIVDASLGVIVHSQYTKEKIQEEIPYARVWVVPQGINLQDIKPISGDEVRSELNIPHDFIVFASFGLITPHKRIDVVLRAFARLKSQYSKLLYVLVGDISPAFPLNHLIKELNLEDFVKITGFVEIESFKNYIQASDLCINLRYPTAGETSASLLRIMAAGKPVIVSNIGSFVEFPDACCAKVDVDETEEENLYQWMKYFVENPDVRHAMGEKARKYVEENHSLERSAAAYMDCIRQVREDTFNSTGTKTYHRYVSKGINDPIMIKVNDAVLDLVSPYYACDYFRLVYSEAFDLGLQFPEVAIPLPEGVIPPETSQYTMSRYYQIKQIYKHLGLWGTTQRVVSRAGNFLKRKYRNTVRIRT